jgi:V/A-type H+-transporting ATPase subunit D
MTARRVPPGRAGRVWLVHRLATAEHGADVLNRKLLILRHEQQRLSLLLERSETDWQRECVRAQDWLLRAVLMGGQHSLRMAAPRRPAEVELGWRSEMGVRYPDTAACRLPTRTEDEPTPGNAALVLAEQAFREALQAGVQHAVAQAAVRQVDAEVLATRTRLRALTDRVVPRLAQALQQLELDLEQAEHEDAVRRRWAAGHAVGEP